MYAEALPQCIVTISLGFCSVLLKCFLTCQKMPTHTFTLCTFTMYAGGHSSSWVLKLLFSPAVLSKLATPGARETIEWIEENDGWASVPSAKEWIFLSSQFRSANKSALPDSFLQGLGFRVLGAVHLEFCAYKPRILACCHHPRLQSLPTHLSFSLSLSKVAQTERGRKRKRELSLNQTLALELQTLKLVCRGVLIPVLGERARLHFPSPICWLFDVHRPDQGISQLSSLVLAKGSSDGAFELWGFREWSFGAALESGVLQELWELRRGRKEEEEKEDGECVVPAVSDSAHPRHEGRCDEVRAARHGRQRCQCAAAHHDRGGAHAGHRPGGDRDQLIGAQRRVPRAQARPHPAHQRPRHGDASLPRLRCLWRRREVLSFPPPTSLFVVHLLWAPRVWSSLATVLICVCVSLCACVAVVVILCMLHRIVEEGFCVRVTEFCLWWIVNYCWCPAWWEPVSANAQVWLLLNRVPLECEVHIRADTRCHQPWLAELGSWCGACGFSRPPGWCQWIWSPRTQVFIHSFNAYGDVPTTHPPASKRKKNSSPLVLHVCLPLCSTTFWWGSLGMWKILKEWLGSLPNGFIKHSFQFGLVFTGASWLWSCGKDRSWSYGQLPERGLVRTMPSGHLLQLWLSNMSQISTSMRHWWNRYPWMRSESGWKVAQLKSLNLIQFLNKWVHECRAASLMRLIDDSDLSVHFSMFSTLLIICLV